MQVALDEQIFAIQRHGGISRLFFEQALQFIDDPTLGVELLPLQAPVVNEYVLGSARTRDSLEVREAKGPYRALARYFARTRHSDAVDICHTTFYLPGGLKDYPAARHVVTIYDMIPELLPSTRRRLDFLTLKRKYIENADHVVCISESTRNDLFRIYPELHMPTTIAYPGVASKFQPEVERLPALPEEYILHVGKRSSYKDGITLIEAFSRISHRFPDVWLALVGGGVLSRRERTLMRSTGIEERVRQVDLPDAQMPSAYANALVTVLPSRYEGFGLPAVEALASGCPLILAHTSSLPEVGGDAAVYFPPGDVGSLASVLQDVLSDSTMRTELRNRGLVQAGKFTWRGFGESNVAAYNAALA